MAMLNFRLVSAPPGAAPPALPSFSAAATIGRSEGNTLVLPDPTALLSRQHCRLEPTGAGWQVVDLSSNGTYVNDMLIGRGQVRPLSLGDRLKLGDWVFSIEGPGAAAAAPAFSPGAAPDPLDPFGVNDFSRAQPAAPVQAPLPPRVDPGHGMFGADPFQAAPSSPMQGGMSGPASAPDPFGALPDPFGPGNDPFAAAPPPPGAAPLPDVPPVLHGGLDAMSVPLPSVGPAPSGPSSGLPDDWMDDALAGLAPKGAAPATPAPRPPPPPPPPDPVDFAPPLPPPPRAQAVATPPPSSPAAAGDGMAAFLEGAAVPAPPGVPPDAAMRELGRSTRLLSGSLMRLLAARRAVKGEFRISQTVVTARENNPLKFSADEAEVLATLMGAARPGFQAGAAAVTDACRDLEAHQVALLAAFRAVMGHVFARLDPQAIAGKEDDAGLLGRLTGGAKGAAFDRYQQVYADLRQDFSEGLKGRLAQAFADAYEEESRRRGGS
jgi:type VI secretion system protein ImpI